MPWQDRVFLYRRHGAQGGYGQTRYPVSADRAKLEVVSVFYPPSANYESWFRIGPIAVTSTVLVTMLGIVGTVLSALVPGLIGATALISAPVFAGQLWRLATWPWFDQISIFTALTLLMFWYFGSFLEAELGKVKMLKFLVVVWAVVTVAHLLAGLVMMNSAVAIGLGMPQLLLLLLFIMEQPRRPFFFGIQAWIIGLILVALQVLQLISMRNWGSLLALVLTMALTAILVRRYFGLLTEYSWLNGIGSASRAHQKPSRRTRVQQQRHHNDEARIDELLGKISAGGMAALSKKELSELHALRKRRQNRT